MNKRRSDEQQAQAIRERLALRAKADTSPPVATELATDTAATAARAEQARSHFLGTQLEQLVSNRTIESLPIVQIAPELRPGMRQPRMVPLPDQLVVQGETVPAYAELVAELRDLGASLRERQIQPIVIYPGSSDIFPSARYLILVGQRRWTAAHLVGMGFIDAIVIEPPNSLDRISLQFAENETREDFSDIERAWTLQQLRMAMGGEQVGVNEVATRLNIKRSRAYQLLRMLAFPPEQQETIALLRLQERQLLPLIDAYHQNSITPDESRTVLHRLEQIAAERSLGSRQLADQETTRSVEAPRRIGIDAATVARLVARVSGNGEHKKSEGGDPRWFTTLLDDVESVARKLRRSTDRVEEISQDKALELRGRLQELQRQAQQLVGRLDEGSHGG